MIGKTPVVKAPSVAAMNAAFALLANQANAATATPYDASVPAPATTSTTAYWLYGLGVLALVGLFFYRKKHSS